MCFEYSDINNENAEAIDKTAQGECEKISNRIPYIA